MYDYNARYYDPLLGRFVSADTIVPGAGKPQALNRYAYTFNNPLKYTDPSGHCSSDPANDHDGRCEQRTDDSAAWILGLPGDVDDTLTDAWFASHPNYNPAKDDIESWAEATGHIPGTSRFILSAAYLRWSIANGTDEQASLGAFMAAAGSAGVPSNMGPAGASPLAAASVSSNKKKGDAFRDQVADDLQQSGRAVKKGVVKKTPFGDRRIDIEVTQPDGTKGGVETKTGGARYSPSQRAKDNWLKMFMNYIVNVVRDK